MAYLITAVPEEFASVNDDLIYTVSETTKTADPVTYPNYKFIGDVYVDAVLVARIKKVPDPTTGIGIFNVGQIVRNYLTASFNPTPGAVVAQQTGNGIWNVKVTMHFGEEYAFTEYLDVDVDAQRLFYNHYDGRYIGSESNLSGLPDKVTSTRPPTNHTLLTSQFNFISYFPTTTTPVLFAVTPAGGGTIYVTNFTPANAHDLQILNVSPVAINAANPGTITGTTTSYLIQIGSQFYLFNIICESRYTPRMIHFMNQYGGFDSKLFTKVSRSSVDIERKDFGKIRYQVDGSGAVSFANSNKVVYDSRTVYSINRIAKLLLNTDILSDAEYVWLADLMASPMVYIEQDGYFFSVVVKETNYEPRKSINDDLTNLTINIEYGQTFNSQYR